MSTEVSATSSVLLLRNVFRTAPHRAQSLIKPINTDPAAANGNATACHHECQQALCGGCTHTGWLIQQQAFPAFQYLTSIPEDPSPPSTSRAETPVRQAASSCISVSKPAYFSGRCEPQSSVTSHWQVIEAVVWDLCVGWPQRGRRSAH